MAREKNLSIARLARSAAVAAAALFLFGGSLAYFIRFTFAVYYSYKLGFANGLWTMLQSAAGG